MSPSGVFSREFLFKPQPRQRWLTGKELCQHLWDACIIQNTLRSQSESDYAPDIDEEAAFVQPTNNRHISSRLRRSVPTPWCHFTVDVRWRQTYFQTSLLRECHRATCLAHLRTWLSKSGRKLLNRSPSFFFFFLTEFSHRQAALA